MIAQVSGPNYYEPEVALRAAWLKVLTGDEIKLYDALTAAIPDGFLDLELFCRHNRISKARCGKALNRLESRGFVNVEGEV